MKKGILNITASHVYKKHQVAVWSTVNGHVLLYGIKSDIILMKGHIAVMEDLMITFAVYCYNTTTTTTTTMLHY